MNRHANIQARGMTLVELLVAVAILSVIVAGVGFVFSRTAAAVSSTQANIDTNANIRATLARLHEDMRMLTKDGFLFASGPTDTTPPVLMFTASGHFVSQTDSSKTANTALIVYMGVKDKYSEATAVLARYVFLLTGDTGDPTLLQILGANPSVSRLDDLTDSDCLSISLAGIRSKIRNDSLYADFCEPLLNTWAEMNTAPATYDGVEDLWPYLAGGLEVDPDGFDAMEIDFNDGKYVNGNTVNPDYPEEWICLNSTDDGKDARDDRDDANGVDAANVSSEEWIVWDFRCNENWPKALRLRMKFGDVSGRLEQPRDVETVLVLPQ